MSAHRPRILFVGEAVTLAHVVRPLTLARSLDAHRYDIHVAWDTRFDALLGDVPFTRWSLRSISSKLFTEKITGTKPVYDEQTLRDYVRDDLLLLGRVKPDLVVGDMRISLGISARLAGIPYATIANAHWSPFAKVAYPAPLHPSTRLLGETAGAFVMNKVRGFVAGMHVAPVNGVRKEVGLAPLSTHAFSHYSDADHVLYADVQGHVEMQSLPSTHHFLGPIVWSPSAALPSWWDRLPTDRPIVYVNLGSSGSSTPLPALLHGLAQLPVTVIAATVNAELGRVPDNVFLARYLPGDAACERASLVVCNGGSGAVHQALLAGVPVIGVTSNFDQQLNMQAPVKHRVAVELRGDRVAADRLNALARGILSDELHAARARVFGLQLAAHRASALFPAFLRQVIGRKMAA